MDLDRWHSFLVKHILKGHFMSTKEMLVSPGSFLLGTVVFLLGCGGGNSGSAGVVLDSSTHLNAPAPDNNSYNNPSSADTMYQYDTVRKRGDSVRGRVSDSLHE
jgi:hypothetical protein